jgi:hypothetical protein
MNDRSIATATSDKTTTVGPMIGFGRLGFGPQVMFEQEGKGGADEPQDEPEGSEAADEPEDTPDPQDEPDGDDPSGDDADDKDKKDGPTDEEARLLKEVMSKKKALKEAQDEVKNLKKQFEGINPDEVRKLLKDKKTAEQKKLEEKGEWDALKKQMNEAHEAEKSELQSRIEELESELGKRDGKLMELTVGQSFTSSKFISEELLLTPRKARVVYGDHFEIEDGKVIAYDKPKGADDRNMLVDGKGEPMGFDEALRKIVDADPDRDNLLRSKLKKGADSKTTDAKAPKNEPDTYGVSRIQASLTAGNSKK